MDEKELSVANANYAIKIIKRSTQPGLPLQLLYANFHDFHDKRLQKSGLKESLHHVHTSVKKIILDLKYPGMELQKYFDALLAGIHSTLDCIHVTGGEFYDYQATDNTASRGQHVRSLIFQKISIDGENALHSST